MEKDRLFQSERKAWGRERQTSIIRKAMTSGQPVTGQLMIFSAKPCLLAAGILRRQRQTMILKPADSKIDQFPLCHEACGSGADLGYPFVTALCECRPDVVKVIVVPDLFPKGLPDSGTACNQRRSFFMETFVGKVSAGLGKVQGGVVPVADTQEQDEAVQIVQAGQRAVFAESRAQSVVVREKLRLGSMCSE